MLRHIKHQKIASPAQGSPKRTGYPEASSEPEDHGKSQRSHKRHNKLQNHVFHIPTIHIEAIKPLARAPAHRILSISRIIPAIVSPISISRIEFVIAIPGISSIISPIIILSA